MRQKPTGAIISYLDQLVGKSTRTTSTRKPKGLVEPLQGHAFIDLIVECATQNPPIKCYGSDFDPKHIKKIPGTDNYNPYWVNQALDHVDQENMRILLTRINQKENNRFPSVQELRESIQACIR
ncbi:MAG: hypothetical protein Q7S22_05140 [Candidatus Micrarchaeota archaeon]|nr:hypothetical protein [Candidatus Micrarchaeota archaeon]